MLLVGYTVVVSIVFESLALSPPFGAAPHSGQSMSASSPAPSALSTFFRNDLLASAVVFLVALPLCMGIAIASGVPPALGLVSGIIGGLVVGLLAGSPLQVSGPAAGLAVVVWDLVHKHGLEALGIVVLMAGAFQVGAAVLKSGRWFRAVPPSVIRGMLAGIGVLIFGSQFHVMVDDAPRKGGISNLLSIPEAIWKGLMPVDGTSHHLAAYIGVLTIGTILAWNRFRPKRLKAVPGPLMGVVVGTAAAAIFAMPIQYVTVPENLVASLNFVGLETLGIVTLELVGAAAAMAAIASAESLLCATAVDQLHSGPRTRYDRELLAQGVGNIFAGFLGALPITGVIVRSSANVEAGGKSRWSAVAHGAWLLGLVVAAPFVLSAIPTSSLAAVLVFTGWKLMDPKALKELRRHGKSEVAIFVVVVLGVVATNLLTGIMIGLVLAIVRLLVQLARVKVTVSDEADGSKKVVLTGVASFVSLPRIAEALEAVPAGVPVSLDTDHLHYVDAACVELVENWARQHQGRGAGAVVDMDRARFPTGTKAA